MGQLARGYPPRGDDVYVRYPLALRNVEDLRHDRGMDTCHETVRLWVERFVPKFAGEARRARVQARCRHTRWRWRLDEVSVRNQRRAAPPLAGARVLSSAG